MIVTGTDTGVGKTVVSAAVCAITGRSYVKAVQTGDDDDAAEVARLAGVPTRVLARFADPLAPASAGSTLTLDDIEAPANAVVEGAGGILVRLGDFTLADVARKLDMPVLVVARAGLGSLNHTALTCEALRARDIECLGVVIGSWPDAPGLAERRNLEDLPRYAGAPLLGRVPAGAARLDPADFRAHAPTWIEGLPL